MPLFTNVGLSLTRLRKSISILLLNRPTIVVIPCVLLSMRLNVKILEIFENFSKSTRWTIHRSVMRLRLYNRAMKKLRRILMPLKLLKLPHLLRLILLLKLNKMRCLYEIKLSSRE
nr:MAG: hypothetical protein [Microvirus sp.]